VGKEMAIGPALDDSWGAVLIGVFLAIFLYGLLTLQVFVYQELFPRDVWWLKCVVASVWILDTSHTIFICHMIYSTLITNFGDYDAIAHNIWSFNINVLITTIVAAISQVFFIHRCWRFDKSIFNTVASAIILCFAAVQFAFGSLCAHLTFSLSLYSQFLDYKWAVDTWLGSAAATDILVSVALVRSLLMKRNEVQRTRGLIERLIRWTVTTGLITSVWALLDLAVFTASQTTLIHLFFNIMLAKLYANTLLAALNHRSPNRPDDSAPVPQTQASGISLGAMSPRLSRLSRASRGSRASRTLTLTTTTTTNSVAGRHTRGGRAQSVSFALDSGFDIDLEQARGVRVDVETTMGTVSALSTGTGSLDDKSDALESPGSSLPTLGSQRTEEESQRPKESRVERQRSPPTPPREDD